jgi:hypothetical protein
MVVGLVCGWDLAQPRQYLVTPNRELQIHFSNYGLTQAAGSTGFKTLRANCSSLAIDAAQAD